jgi:hypothetical protein
VNKTGIIEKKVDFEREKFRSIAIRGSVLYFVISDIPAINPMYQYSLFFIIKLFCAAIQNTTSSDKRVFRLMENVTKDIFTVVCRGLFEKDKKLIGFLFATAIQRNENLILNDA